MIRAFLGLDLPGDIRSALAVQQFVLPLPRRIDPALFHLTLVFLGDQSDATLEALHEGFAALKIAPFDLSLQGLGLYGGNRPTSAWAGVARSEPLMRLQAKADRVARQILPQLEHRRFSPHVTLGNFRPPGFAETASLERAVAETPFRAGPWQVQGMVLWQSTLSHKGPHYTPLAQYPFS